MPYSRRSNLALYRMLSKQGESRMTRHEGARETLRGALPPPTGAFAACETYLDEGIGLVQEYALMLEDL